MTKKKKSVIVFLTTFIAVLAFCFSAAACSGEKTYKLTFMNGDEVYKVYESTAGEAITDLTAPARDGYTFEGWVTESGEEYVPSVMPNSDVTVSAKFVANTYTVKFVGGGRIHR